jgi:hypothetical protein
MQVLDVSASVSSALPVPLKACLASAMGDVDLSACSVLVHDHNVVGDFSGAGLSPKLKAVVDPACTLERVYSGLCSACTAAAAMAGTCPPGTHTFILDMELRGTLAPDNVLAMVLRVGSTLLSAEVMIQFEVISDTRGRSGDGQEATEALQSMLLSSKVCVFDSEILATHSIVFQCGIQYCFVLCSSYMH